MATLEPLKVVGVSLNFDHARGVVFVRITEEEPETGARVEREVFAAKTNPENLARAHEVTLEYAEKMRGERGRSLSPPELDRERLQQALLESLAAYEEALRQAAVARQQRDRADIEVERLRWLVQAVVAKGSDVATPTDSKPIEWEMRCRYCSSKPGEHYGNCPWPALAAEAEKALVAP
jgi:hypothetical protein